MKRTYRLTLWGSREGQAETEGAASCNREAVKGGDKGAGHPITAGESGQRLGSWACGNATLTTSNGKSRNDRCFTASLTLWSKKCQSSVVKPDYIHLSQRWQ